jgi:hypothetical protein
MPRLVARRPVRRGVECALRSRAAEVDESREERDWAYAKRSGRGTFVDLMVRREV